MADTVRNIMENMVPELQDLEARGYFTKKEIREIVKRRSDFEYLLKRKAARKGDYLRCHALQLMFADGVPLAAQAVQLRVATEILQWFYPFCAESREKAGVPYMRGCRHSRGAFC